MPGVSDGPGPPADNPGRNRACVFLGAITRLTADLDAGGQVLANIPTGSATEPGIGDRAYASWALAHDRVLKDD